MIIYIVNITNTQNGVYCLYSAIPLFSLSFGFLSSNNQIPGGLITNIRKSFKTMGKRKLYKSE